MKKSNWFALEWDISRLKKILRVMKTTIFLLLISGLSVLASVSYSQTKTITLDLKDTSLKEVLQKIEEQSEFRFMYSEKLVDVQRKVSVKFKDERISEVLNELFAGTDVNYKVKDRFILLSTPEVMGNEFIVYQQRSVSGKVTDSGGQPLPGVSIVIKGTTQGTVSNTDGEYSLSNIPADATLIFSFVGMKTHEVVVGNQTSISVVMEEDVIGIEEVVAIGYGTVKKRDLTGAISSISSSEIDERPGINDITQALHGGIAGLDVSMDPSAKGRGDFLIRGQTSLLANNAPLIVIDEMIYDGDIADINPLDIKSLDILKDASASAIYGARAASGVILITTKKGEKGKPKIRLNISTGFTSLQNIQEVYDLEGYLQQRVDYWETNRPEMPEGYFRPPDNLPSNITLEQWRGYDEGSTLSDLEMWFSRNNFDGEEFKNYKAGNITDWFDLIFRTGLRQNYDVSISGANNNISYYYSLGYLGNEGFYVDENYESIRSRFNLKANITDFLDVGINAQYSRRDESSQFPSLLNTIGNSPLGSLYNEDGTYKLYPHNDGHRFAGNPFYYEYSDKSYINDNLMSNIFAEIELPWNFNYRCNWINNIQWRNDYSFWYTTDELTGEGGSRSEYKYHKWFLDNILTWERTISDIHEFDFTFLYNLEKAIIWNSSTTSSDYVPSEALGYHQLGFGTNVQTSNDDEVFTGDALLARLNYSLMDKYLFTAAFRRDGYSVFGTKNPYAYFPTGAIAWRLSEEDFFNVKWVDYLKLRISYGINGNRDIPTYQSLAYLEPISYVYQTENGKQTFVGLYSSRMANADLRWEKTKAWNAGIDFSILKEKLSGAIEGYYMSTTDLILERSLPILTGYNAVTSNLGEVQNKGVELTLNSRNVSNQNFEWNSQYIFYLNRNKIKHLYGDMMDVTDEEGNVIGQTEAPDYSNNWFIGRSIDVIWNYELDGIWQLGEEEEAAEWGQTPGDFKVVDQNGDGDILPRDDKKFLGYTTPRYKMSLYNNFKVLKNFDLSFLLNAQLGHHGVMASKDLGSQGDVHFHGGFEYGRMNRYKYPYWTKDNPTNEWARLSSSNPYQAVSYHNRSFVKLNNILVGYRIPDKFINQYKIESLKLSFQLRNAITMTSWDFWDPETIKPTPMIGTFNINIVL
jgi:TonB-dependent starch-binding outer membrane protein SusC